MIDASPDFIASCTDNAHSIAKFAHFLPQPESASLSSASLTVALPGKEKNKQHDFTIAMIRMPFRHVVALSLLAAPLSQGAVSIGWNYSHSGFGDENLAAAEVAGAPGFAQANWNNHASGGQAPGSVPLNDLTADNGGTAVSTTVDVVSWSQSTNNSWHYNGHGSTPDDKLMGGFGNQDMTLTFADVNSFTPDGYTVVVYYGNNEFFTNPTTTIDVNGQIQTIQTSDVLASVGYIQNTDNGATDSNYAVFTGVSGDTLTIDLQSSQNDGISAVQSIQIPEPASAGLLGVGLLLTALRRRR